MSDSIDRFHSHFLQQIELIKNLKSDKSVETFQASLYCSILDALSRFVYPRHANGDRFRSLVRRFGRWKHVDHVSLPHLARLLELVPDPPFEKLRKFVQEKIVTWKDSWPDTALNQDPTKDEILKMWPSSPEYKQPIPKITLESLTHLQLLYSHRNFLVHELRPPGYGISLGDEIEPFYHELSTYHSVTRPPIDSIELVYPTGFFENICRTVLDNLKIYFEEYNIDPFVVNNKFGSYWLENLNGSDA